jgi:hypothetical protein
MGLILKQKYAHTGVPFRLMLVQLPNLAFVETKRMQTLTNRMSRVELKPWVLYVDIYAFCIVRKNDVILCSIERMLQPVSFRSGGYADIA